MIFFALLMALLPSLPAWAANPSALWNIESTQCIPHQRDGAGPKPCAEVDLRNGYVILKDLVGATQYLLMPTERIGGIESSAVLAPDAPNYWDAAWRSRHFMEEKAGRPLPRESISLTVNSPSGRTQNQLHIHIDCPRMDVRDALIAHRDEIGPAWSTFSTPLAGFSWRVRRIDGADLGLINPFRLLADDGAIMADHTLAVVGMTWPSGQAGFVVLDGKVDLAAGNMGSAEVLQDHDCAVLR